LLRNLAEAEAQWLEQTSVLPINHVLVVREDLAEEHPWLTRDLFELFGTAFERTGSQNPRGLEAIRTAIELLGRFACEQGIIPRPYAAEELFEAF
jgi:4,5-dihydroxyphthalate decarboxylase